MPTLVELLMAVLSHVGSYSWLYWSPEGTPVVLARQIEFVAANVININRSMFLERLVTLFGPPSVPHPANSGKHISPVPTSAKTIFALISSQVL